MSKRTKKFHITEHVSGSFVGSQGRVTFELDAGPVSEKEIDAEVVAFLEGAGLLVDPDAPPPEAEIAGASLAPASAESEESA